MPAARSLSLYRLVAADVPARSLLTPSACFHTPRKAPPKRGTPTRCCRLTSLGSHAGQAAVGRRGRKPSPPVPAAELTARCASDFPHATLLASGRPSSLRESAPVQSTGSTVLRCGSTSSPGHRRKTGRRPPPPLQERAGGRGKADFSLSPTLPIYPKHSSARRFNAPLSLPSRSASTSSVAFPTMTPTLRSTPAAGPAPRASRLPCTPLTTRNC